MLQTFDHFRVYKLEVFFCRNLHISRGGVLYILYISEMQLLMQLIQNILQYLKQKVDHNATF